MSLQNLSLSQKLLSALAILLVPIAALLYFVVIEKDSQIQSTRKEMAGVAYLRALQQGFASALAEESSGSASAILKAEDADQGRLALTQQSRAIAADFRSGQFDAALTKLSEAITMASDNSNITLDPETDAYFVGDIMVNQAQAILQRSDGLVAAARILQRAKSEEATIAFAVARENLTTAAASFANDWTRAVNGNADGRLRAEMGATMEPIAALLPKLVQAAKDRDLAAVLKLAPDMESRILTALPKLDDAMQRLLEARVAGFRAAVFARVAFSLVIALLGLLAALLVIRSVTRPIINIVQALDSIQNGRFDIVVPEVRSRDEIGLLAIAAQRYRDAAAQAVRAQGDSKARHEQELRDMSARENANAAFTNAMHGAIAALGRQIKQTEGGACRIADQTDAAASQAEAIARAAQQASETVQLVASSADELAASITDIAGSVIEASEITSAASRDMRQAQAMVENLSEASEKISAVISLITDIAAQTNLLALNATIEAARAGEAGRGFAVVAAEVKTLAGQTARATEEIAGHIHAVTEASGRVIAAMNGVEGTIEKVNLVSTAIAGVIEQQRAATREIASNIQLAASSSEEVTISIAQVAQAIAVSRTETLEVRNVVGELEQEAARLHENVANYVSGAKAA
ncbi:HAMP domain-containing protein [Rhodoblastus acidophilus]|uniref:HAMP domain-containing protein n=1 Tax=Rhodoblastus acidophilus TaxID=1074 RepID=A0A6N8DH75_RHOAC|nr:HAMP domain-containing methyl-accepting chemotaxis protein [Rhodoblastus acidophilus]MCW2272801.1 methyl-accepting chemotaxis protein [Rhodoblastus acidophilus]MTV29712.1 HAMP domain-containing protein [Rhodoblastus acidophilus]